MYIKYSVYYMHTFIYLYTYILYIYIYIYIYIVTSWRQSNAPILLITTMALWRHAGYGRLVAELINIYIYVYIYIYIYYVCLYLFYFICNFFWFIICLLFHFLDIFMHHSEHPLFFSWGALDRTSIFRGELLGKRGVTFFQ